MTFWWRWLIGAACIVLAFGLALVVLAMPMQVVFESVYFAPRADSALGTDAVAYTAFMGAVLGAVMVGWAALLLYVLAGPFRRVESAGWDMIAVSLGVWFMADTAYSLVSGFWQNAVLNAAMFTIFAVPLVATYGRFHGGERAVVRPTPAASKGEQ